MDIKKSIATSEGELINTQLEFNSTNDRLTSMLELCDIEIKKGGENSISNRKFIESKIERNTESFVEKIININKSIKDDKESVEEFRKACFSEIENKNEESKGAFLLAINDFQKGILKSSSGSIVSDKDLAIAVAMGKAGISKATKDEFDCMCKSGSDQNVEDSPPKPVTSKNSVAVIVKDSVGRTLFLKRNSTDDFHPNTWCLPGGGIDSGESPIEAAVRELKEESNIFIEVPDLILSDIIEVESGKKIHYYTHNLRKDLEKPIATLDGEMSNYVFLDPSEYCEYDLILDLKDHLLRIETSQANMFKAFNKQSIQKAFNIKAIDEEKYNSLKEIIG